MPTIGEMGSDQKKSRDEFRGLLPSAAPAPLLRSPSPFHSTTARHLPAGIIALIHAIVSDLESRPNCILGLNPSRRDAICNHLNQLAFGNSPGTGRPNLGTWLQPGRTSAESQALFSYFEEVALMTIGQALLLKRWSDRGLRPFRSEHLGKLNYELSTGLRPHVPLHREGFHLTRPNLYSWYTLPTALQEELFQTLETIDLREESPTLLLELSTDGRRFSPEWPELLGYDSRFYCEASSELLRWATIARTSAAKKKIGFTPTLRLGQITHANGEDSQWIGCEENTFSLLISEMIDLWWGPKAPPVWANTHALDVHPREQLSLLSTSAGAPGLKSPTITLLSDMEACDFGWIAEERTQKASKWKAQLDSLPFFKKLRTSGTHLGTLQACVAVTKIRPGGRLVWAREEPITNDEGGEALSHLLGRAKLLAEIDLSGVEHSLPTRRPLFPRFLYVFERELQHDVRLAHRPVRWIGQGAIKSHVEIPLFLSDVFATLPSTSTTQPSLPNRANWKLSSQVSPLAQKEWMNRWPDPACARSLSALEEMNRGTVPLANLATIRGVNRVQVEALAHTPSGILETIAGKVESISTNRGKGIDPRQPGLFVEAVSGVVGQSDSRRLQARAFGELVPGMEYSGFAVLLRDPAWIEPIRAFLESSRVAQWLEHHAERRGEKWVLSESLVKMIPIPERLASAIARDSGSSELREFALAVSKAPESLQSATTLPPEVRYVAVAVALRELELHSTRLRPFIVTGESGETRIEWSKLLGLLGSADSLPLTHHPFIRIVGTIPPNVPLTKVERLKAPQNGLLLMTESGGLQKVVFDHRMLAEMAWDQAKFHPHPTWGELVATIRLPRSLEMAESAAHEILVSYEDVERRRKALKNWLSAGLPSA